MNIKFQICGLIILFVILLLSMFQRKVRLYSELLFLAVLEISILNVSMDIISVIAIANKANISRLLLDTICKAYPITLIMTACIYLIYSLYDVLPYKKFKIAQMAAIIMFVIESIITAVLPIEYYVKGDVLFTYGPAITCTYAAAVLDIIIVFTLVTFYSKHMNPQRLIVMRMWIFIHGAASMSLTGDYDLSDQETRKMLEEVYYSFI